MCVALSLTDTRTVTENSVSLLLLYFKEHNMYVYVNTKKLSLKEK